MTPELVTAIRIIADICLGVAGLAVALTLVGYSRFSGDWIYRRVSLILAAFVCVRSLSPMVDIVTALQGDSANLSLARLVASMLALSCAGGFVRFLPPAWNIAKQRMLGEDRLDRLQKEVEMWRKHFERVRDHASNGH